MRQSGAANCNLIPPGWFNTTFGEFCVCTLMRAPQSCPLKAERGRQKGPMSPIGKAVPTARGTHVVHSEDFRRSGFPNRPFTLLGILVVLKSCQAIGENIIVLISGLVTIRAAMYLRPSSSSADGTFQTIARGNTDAQFPEFNDTDSPYLII